MLKFVQIVFLLINWINFNIALSCFEIYTITLETGLRILEMKKLKPYLLLIQTEFKGFLRSSFFSDRLLYKIFELIFMVFIVLLLGFYLPHILNFIINAKPKELGFILRGLDYSFIPSLFLLLIIKMKVYTPSFRIKNNYRVMPLNRKFLIFQKLLTSIILDKKDLFFTISLSLFYSSIFKEVNLYSILISIFFINIYLGCLVFYIYYQAAKIKILKSAPKLLVVILNIILLAFVINFKFSVINIASFSMIHQNICYLSFLPLGALVLVSFLAYSYYYDYHKVACGDFGKIAENGKRRSLLFNGKTHFFKMLNLELIKTFRSKLIKNTLLLSLITSPIVIYLSIKFSDAPKADTIMFFFPFFATNGGIVAGYGSNVFSLEGKNLRYLFTLPITLRNFIKSKILFMQLAIIFSSFPYLLGAHYYNPFIIKLFCYYLFYFLLIVPPIWILIAASYPVKVNLEEVSFKKKKISQEILVGITNGFPIFFYLLISYLFYHGIDLMVSIDNFLVIAGFSYLVVIILYKFIIDFLWKVVSEKKHEIILGVTND